ncbi:MAG: AbrB/MazE/SpoVT family DNA-binding domain-containing protein [Methanocellales archaeon]|nr:AbrB/MazE/SpoVT family DNA-binding domain-containing protein [Methanocellales archaeon]
MITLATVKMSSRGQVVIPQQLREGLGLVEGCKLKVYQEGKKIIMVAEPESKPEELFVAASKDATKKAMEISHELDETKLRELLKEIGVKA